jgi:hypothetical protein
MAFRVKDLLGQTVEVYRQGCQLQDSFSVLDALYVSHSYACS